MTNQGAPRAISRANFAPTHDLPDNAALEAALVELIALGLLAKQAHWNIAGPTFGPLHVLLDGIADLARATSDQLAERVSILGRHPDGRVATVARESILPDLGAGGLRDRDAVVAFENILDIVASRLQDALAAASDPVTQDLLTNITGEIEKQAWVIRSHR